MLQRVTGTPRALFLLLVFLALLAVGAGVALLLIVHDGPEPAVERVELPPAKVSTPDPPAWGLHGVGGRGVGRETFAAEERERIARAIEDLLRHPSSLCGTFGRSIWHRWEDNLLSNGSETALCVPGRYAYMSARSGETYLCPLAFRSHDQLVETLAHEERHHLEPYQTHRRAADWNYMCGFWSR